uniref:AraC family transcriptional regulator n=1 Tax=Ningiella ruwaisensis TaxID=2364274 RepID=UPI001F4F1CBC|nr:AraC family transcriptional regulator [Ningiella ruwaisensis]
MFEQVSEYYSALSGWLIPFSRAMEDNGIDVNTALAECDIVPSVMADQESRLAADKFAQLVQYANNKLGRKDFAILVAKQFYPSMFHALGYAMMSSVSLHDALERIARYKRVVSNTCTLNVEEVSSELRFSMNVATYEDSGRPVLDICLVEIFLGTIVTFSRELVGKQISPLSVHFASPASAHDDEKLRAFFGCDIYYDAQQHHMVFSREVADKKLLVGNTLITQVHEKMLDDLLSRIDRSDLIYLVKKKIYDALPMGAPSQNQVAQDLGMSLRNLQRKLGERGTSYKELLETTRKKLAIEYMQQHHLSFSEIGYLVGFSSVGNFNRAFKRWTNLTPGEYRQTELSPN